jgi:hypothetical protein
MSQSDSAGEVLHTSFVTYTKANKTAALGVPAAHCSEKKGASMTRLPSPWQKAHWHVHRRISRWP